MPRDDREQNFDQALARHLGSSSAAHANDCLDAETLAAYHERLLDPEEMAQHKAHIASCERCQQILAQLEATDAIPVEADRDLMLDQIVLEIPESETAPAAATPAATEPQLEPQPQPEPEELAIPMAAAPQAENPVAPESETESEIEIEHEPDLIAASAALPSLTRSQPATPAAPSLAQPASPALAASVFPSAAKSGSPTSSTITFRSPREDRPKIVRFFALFGAIAAAVIFWLVFRDQSNKNFELAQNHQQKLEMPPQSPSQSPAPPSGDKASVSSSQTAEPNAAFSKGAAAAPPAQPQQAPAQAPTDSATNALDEGKSALDAAKALELKTRKDAAAQAPAFIPRDEDSSSSSRAARQAVAASPRKPAPASPVEKALADANAVLHPTSNAPSSIPTTPPPARSKVSPGIVNEVATADSISRGGAQLSASSTPVNGRMVNTLSTLTPLSVPAPSGKIIWRIGQAGQIQRSTDAGATWSIQPSGVVTDLIAGSAYSDQVCWLVGRNGTVLRTVNGGATWQKLASPSSADLLGVFSINADSATITDAAGRAFETTSAGSHWTRTRLQQ